MFVLSFPGAVVWAESAPAPSQRRDTGRDCWLGSGGGGGSRDTWTALCAGENACWSSIPAHIHECINAEPELSKKKGEKKVGDLWEEKLLQFTLIQILIA